MAERDLMSTATIPSASDVLDDLYRMSVDEYELLADAEFLQDRRVELINGWLVSL